MGIVTRDGKPGVLEYTDEGHGRGRNLRAAGVKHGHGSVWGVHTHTTTGIGIR